MNLKIAVIVGAIGASIATVLSILPIFRDSQILLFLYQNPLIGIAIKTIPNICYLFFFITLLQNKKK